MHIKMTDRAGNTSEDELIFSIDKTKPEIKIAFDNETPDAENTTMFKENRVATITVTERNFEAADFKADITNTDGVIPELSAWQTTENTENPDQSVSTATITFAEDGDYTLSVSGKDKAANQAETVKADDFTIDKTRPVITVTYDNNNAVNGNYYAAARTATIQIEEHNFSENRVRITGTATDNGAGISFPQSGGFTGNGDVHTATITCGTDGLYNFNVEYTDMAGNIADHLCRLFRPRSLTIIHRVIIYLRMPDGSYNTKLYTLLSSRQSGKESTLMIVIERTAQSITHFVRESSNTRHLISIGFHCQRIFRHLWSRCRPSFTIYKYSRIYRRCRLTDFVHCLDVMNTHQVKTESVNVIFINPM